MFFRIAILLFLAAIAIASTAYGLKAEPQPSPKPECAIDIISLTQSYTESKHHLLVTFPDDIARRFIVVWNNEIARKIPVTVDGVVVFSNSALLRIAFFKDNCLYDVFDLDIATFDEMLRETLDLNRKTI